MNCKQCGITLTGRQQAFCSDKCRKRLTRTKARPEDVSGSSNPDTAILNQPLNPDMYQARTNPDKLNWGPWMDAAGLDEADLIANRVPIPGDYDYVKIETPDVMYMTAAELIRRLHYIRDWKRSPEHVEIMRRLHTMTVEQLEAQGQPVPAWKREEAVA